MIDFIVSAVIIVIVGAAFTYIIRSGKNGIKCVGCPDAKNCSSLSPVGKIVPTCGCGSGACAGCSRHTDTKSNSAS